MAASDLFVENFKSQMVGGGARANLFKAILNLDNVNNEQASFMCKAASLPGSTVAEIEVPFRGRTIKVAGDRTFEPWTITVINDTNFSIRDEFERRMNALNAHVLNVGNQIPASYKSDMYVQQLDKFGSILKEYKFIGVFPTTVDAIDVSYENTGAIEEFGVTLQYDYWESNTTT